MLFQHLQGVKGLLHKFYSFVRECRIDKWLGDCYNENNDMTNGEGVRWSNPKSAEGLVPFYCI